jgi:hypothetical protein
VRAQNSDRLSLEETLAGMRRLGVAPVEFVEGYEHGFTGKEDILFSSLWTDDQHRAYRRGHKAGQQAKERGAHERSKA